MMGLPIHLGIVSLAPAVGFGELATVSAALQKQIVRDFGPIWNIEATIDPFARLEDVPLGYWKIMVVDTFDHGGQHRDRKQQPFALVAAGASWSLVASHEALEMLADPFGNRLVAGNSPSLGQGRVEFLVEVCDPCQSDTCGYFVNGILVSDFYAPAYFDPVQAAGVRYSFNGSLTRPHEVAKGGYLSWREPTNGNWFQQKVTAQSTQIVNLGQVAPVNASLRETIDALSPSAYKLAQLPETRPTMRRATKIRRDTDQAAVSSANELRSLLAPPRG